MCPNTDAGMNFKEIEKMKQKKIQMYFFAPFSLLFPFNFYDRMR